jgi:hypothetical protein
LNAPILPAASPAGLNVEAVLAALLFKKKNLVPRWMCHTTPFPAEKLLMDFNLHWTCGLRRSESAQKWRSHAVLRFQTGISTLSNSY